MLLPGITASVLLALAAKAPQPPEPEPLPPPIPFQSKAQDPLLEPVAPAQEQIQSWDQAITMVRRLSTDERTALANVERAAGRSRQALSFLLPNARANVGLGLNILDPDLPPLGVGAFAQTGAPPSAPVLSGTVTLTQSIVDVSAWRGLHAADAAEESASWSLKDVRRRITLGLARSLVGVAAAERVSEMNRVGLRLALERAALTQRKFELGAATQLDVARVQQDLQVARQAVISGDEDLRRAREALGLALGLDHEAGIIAGFNVDGLVTETAAQCRQLEELSDRADLQADRASVESARQSRLQALAGYLPSLGLSSSLFGYTTEPGSGRVGSWSVSAVLSFPIWEGGFRSGLVQERRGIETQAKESLEQTRRDVSIEVTRARRDVEVAQNLLQTAVDARFFAEKTDELTRRSFEFGRASSVDLVQSATTLRQADVTLAVREYESVQARLNAFLTEATCDW